MAQDASEVTATIIVRHAPDAANTGEELLAGHAQTLSREEALRRTSADPKDMAQVKAFLEQHGLRWTAADPATRTIKATGSLKQFADAFGITFGVAGAQRVVEGAIQLPSGLRNVILAVLGLDTRPVASPRTPDDDQP